MTNLRDQSVRSVTNVLRQHVAEHIDARFDLAWSDTAETQHEPARGNLPVIDAFQAGVLLEVLKDLLYQAYVRRGRLQQAMMVRRYFSDDGTNVTPLPGARP